ncbi:putative ABC transporter ATP-binding protein YxlF (plasmid) [Streptomyces sp. ADI95-16]|uniref:ABC transporter ATP-binding protein n=1 Tax=Streptomyces sp. ADI95-16 TaxID=1522758 RepID=UPI000F3AA864|nr:ATP-binding cassette domain-containing protein [Streptomyces sp. ADI95-16]AYV32867.1 putative ABC transporter ATP-binding protein YxlF [Streptomyces sp. ADI95-16]
MPLHYQDCTFRYGRRTRPVLNGLDLEFAPGHTVLLGPNGAGKSTLLSLGAGALRPGSGRVGVGPLSASTRRDTRIYRRKVAWLPQRPGFLPGLTAREHVAYIGWLKGMRERDAWAAAPAAIDRIGLADKLNDRIKTLSGGQQQRVAIAGALVHEAELLLLDEPTVGLDPHQRRRFLDLLVSLRGTMHVIVSTHDIGDLDQAFDQVVVFESGRARFQGPVSLFDSYAAPDCAPGRRLESAYASLLEAAE